MNNVAGSGKLSAHENLALTATPLANDDLETMALCLVAASLPASDLALPGRRLFAFSDASGVILGYGGYECHGCDALLRSVVVDLQYRRRGLGQRIVRELLKRVRLEGARNVFLLTTDAEAFFTGLGFAAITREDAPAAILRTEQASALCPATACLLWQRLGDNAQRDQPRHCSGRPRLP